MLPAPQKKKRGRALLLLRRVNVPAALGLLFAFAGLLLFWVPRAGVVLWALGIVFSLLGFFREPRAYAMFGLYVSALGGALMALFLGDESAPSRIAAWLRRDSSAETEPAVARSRGAKPDTEKPPAKRRAAERVYEPAPSWKNDPIALPPETPADDYFSLESGAVAAAPEASAAEPAPGAAAENAVLPVAIFGDIARRRAEWPRSVRLLRPRSVVLTDDVTKEIVGRMDVPAGTRVRVLEVRRDGSLDVRDEKLRQTFRILAADTDFAAAYAEKIRRLRGGE